MPRLRSVAPLLVLTALLAACTATPESSSVDVAVPGQVAAWQGIEPSGLEARHGAQAFWTGKEVLVLGGDAAKPSCPFQADCNPGPTEFRSDGAAFDPEKGTWRPVASAPVPLVNTSGVVVDGTLFLWVAGSAPGDPLGSAFLSYQVDDDRWERLPDPAGLNASTRLVAAGSHVVAVGGSQENDVTPDRWFDPATGIWSDLPFDPLAPAYDRAAVWTGRDLVTLGIRIDPTIPPNRAPVYSAAAIELAHGDWRRLPDSEITGWNPTWFWSGGRIVNPTIGSADGGQVNNWGRSYPFGGMLAPSGGWSNLPELPPGEGRYQGLSVGGTESVVSSDGWVLHVPTGRWTPLALTPAGRVEGTASTWANDRLFVWGGVQWNGEQGVVLDAGWTWLAP